MLNEVGSILRIINGLSNATNVANCQYKYCGNESGCIFETQSHFMAYISYFENTDAFCRYCIHTASVTKGVIAPRTLPDLYIS